METDAARRLIPTRATIAYGTEKVNLFFPAEHPADTYDRALELLGAMFLLQGALSVIQMRHFSIESNILQVVLGMEGSRYTISDPKEERRNERALTFEKVGASDMQLAPTWYECS